MEFVPATPSNNYDRSFKILLVGDSGVGKSSLILSFISNSSADDVSPIIGVDCELQVVTIGEVTIGERNLQLEIWDKAGEERFGTFKSRSYYRDAHGIMLVYDVTMRDTFTNLSQKWVKEVELHSTNPECIKMFVGNKVDMDHVRSVTREDGIALAQEHKCLYSECSAKRAGNVRQCFEELTRKILVVPSLVDEGNAAAAERPLLAEDEQSSCS